MAKTGLKPQHTIRHQPILGVSAWALMIRAEIRKVADCSLNALITGPSGTGKELIARSIHAHSRRADRPFIPVDCAAVTGTLFVSHIFGHVEGAFTGASHAELGCFRAADGGTILLDEIGELDFDLQAKLLRVLQQRTVIPVGTHEETPIDVRVIAATNRDLRHDVAAGRFRGDLYYRLNVVSLHTTALKDRPEDIEVLASDYLRRLAAQGLPPKRLSDAAIGQMRRHDWPGNVREMENVLERAILFVDDEVIGPEAIARLMADQEVAGPLAANNGPLRSAPGELEASGGSSVSARDADTATDRDASWPTLAQVEREHIVNTLRHTRYNQSAAARSLDIGRHQLLRKIRKYGIRTPDRRGRIAQRDAMSQ